MSEAKGMVKFMKVYVAAIVGSDVQAALENEAKGSIIGLFSSSCYCLMEKSDILMLYEDQWGSVPFGIGFNNIGEVLHKSKLATSMQIYCSKQGIYIMEAGLMLYIIKQVSIPAQKTLKKLSPQMVRCNIRIVRNLLRQWPGGCIKELYDFVDHLFQENENINCIETMNVYSKKSLPYINKLLNALAKNNEEMIKNSLEGLLGMGPGLTPSLDDWLTGFIYTVTFAQNKLKIEYPCIQTMKSLLPTMSRKKTSLISAAYVCAAVKGEGFSLLDNLLTAIMTETEAVDRAAWQILKIGSNSGADMLTGILFAVEALLRLSF